MNKRDDSVSISKALGIMLMVLAHSDFSYMGDGAIYMFHMPLFFFMSGYCFSDRHLSSPKQFLYAKVEKVYFPYVKYSLIFLLLHNLFNRFHLYVDGVYSIRDMLFQGSRIVISMGMHDQLLGGYWFLGNLFWGLLIAYALLKISKNSSLIAIFISLAICIIMDYMKFQVPLIRVDFSDFFSASFILTGIYYKRGNFHVELKPYIILPIGFILVALGVIYWRGCVPIIEAWKILPYFITAIAGTLSIFSIAKLIENKKSNLLILNKIGNTTLPILTWHFLCFKFVSWLIVLIYGLPIDTLVEFPVIQEYAVKGWWILYFFIGLLLPLGIDSLIKSCKESLIVIFKRII